MLLNRKRAVAFAARCPLSCATLLNSVGISPRLAKKLLTPVRTGCGVT